MSKFVYMITSAVLTIIASLSLTISVYGVFEEQLQIKFAGLAACAVGVGFGAINYFAAMSVRQSRALKSLLNESVLTEGTQSTDNSQVMRLLVMMALLSFAIVSYISTIFSGAVDEFQRVQAAQANAPFMQQRSGISDSYQQKAAEIEVQIKAVKQQLMASRDAIHNPNSNSRLAAIDREIIKIDQELANSQAEARRQFEKMKEEEGFGDPQTGRPGGRGKEYYKLLKGYNSLQDVVASLEQQKQALLQERKSAQSPLEQKVWHFKEELVGLNQQRNNLATFREASLKEFDDSLPLTAGYVMIASGLPGKLKGLLQYAKAGNKALVLIVVAMVAGFLLALDTAPILLAALAPISDEEAMQEEQRFHQRLKLLSTIAEKRSKAGETLMVYSEQLYIEKLMSKKYEEEFKRGTGDIPASKFEGRVH